MTDTFYVKLSLGNVTTYIELDRDIFTTANPTYKHLFDGRKKEATLIFNNKLCYELDYQYMHILTDLFTCITIEDKDITVKFKIYKYMLHSLQEFNGKYNMMEVLIKKFPLDAELNEADPWSFCIKSMGLKAYASCVERYKKTKA